MSWKDILKRYNMRERMDIEIYDSMTDAERKKANNKINIFAYSNHKAGGSADRKIQRGEIEVKNTRRDNNINVYVNEKDFEEFKKLFEDEKGYREGEWFFSLDGIITEFRVPNYKIENPYSDTFEKEAGGVSFGGHGANPELFNIRYGKKRRDKNGKESSN